MLLSSLIAFRTTLAFSRSRDRRPPMTSPLARGVMSIRPRPPSLFSFWAYAIFCSMNNLQSLIWLTPFRARCSRSLLSCSVTLDRGLSSSTNAQCIPAESVSAIRKSVTYFVPSATFGKQYYCLPFKMPARISGRAFRKFWSGFSSWAASITSSRRRTSSNAMGVRISN